MRGAQCALVCSMVWYMSRLTCREVLSGMDDTREHSYLVQSILRTLERATMIMRAQMTSNSIVSLALLENPSTCAHCVERCCVNERGRVVKNVRYDDDDDDTETTPVAAGLLLVTMAPC